MDCLYNAYDNHVEHLGLETRDTRAIFYAMRSSVLPVSGIVSPTKKAVVGEKGKRKRKKRRGRGKYNGQVKPNNNARLGLLMPGEEIIPFENEPTAEEIEAMLEEMDREDSLVDALSKINEQDGGFDPTDAFAAADANGLIDGIPWFQQNEDFWEQNGFLIEEDSGLLLPNPGAEISSAIIDRVEKPKQERPEGVKEALGEDDYWDDYNYNYYPRKSYSARLRMAYTPTSVAPWIINTLARLDGLTVKMQQWSWYNSEALMQEAETDAERQIIMTSSYGEEVQDQEDITLEPAIYCITSSKHAQFGAVKPKHGVIALAIQLSLP